MKPHIPDNWPQRGTRFTRFFRTRTQAALTGICRSGGSADTLIREFIRVSGCPPIHVRIADSAAFVANPFPIRVHPCESVVLSLRFSSPHLRQSASICGFNFLSSFLNFKCRFSGKGLQIFFNIVYFTVEYFFWKTDRVSYSVGLLFLV